MTTIRAFHEQERARLAKYAAALQELDETPPVDPLGTDHRAKARRALARLVDRQRRVVRWIEEQHAHELAASTETDT